MLYVRKELVLQGGKGCVCVCVRRKVLMTNGEAVFYIGHCYMCVYVTERVLGDQNERKVRTMAIGTAQNARHDSPKYS